MCLTCGCNQAHRVMGKNVTYEDLRDVAVENGQTVDQVLSTMMAAAKHDRAAHVDEYERPWRPTKAQTQR